MITKMSDGSQTIIRRNLPGTKTCNFSSWPEEAFEEMDSTLAVQQYIQQIIRKDPQGEPIQWDDQAEFTGGVLQMLIISWRPLRLRMKECGSTNTWGSSAWSWMVWPWSYRVPGKFQTLQYFGFCVIFGYISYLILLMKWRIKICSKFKACVLPRSCPQSVGVGACHASITL